MQGLGARGHARQGLFLKQQLCHFQNTINIMCIELMMVYPTDSSIVGNLNSL